MKNAIFFAFAAVLSPSAFAQAPEINANSCELHFWGSDKAQTSNYSGVGGALGAALAGPSPQSPQGLSGDLPNADQAEALKRVDLAALLRVPAVQLIPEQGPLRGKPGSSGPRLTDSTARCYVELIVDFIGYSSHITAGRKFGARFWLRRYLTSGQPAKVQNGGADVKLRLYPAKSPDERQAAIAELQGAFGQVAAKFLASKQEKP